MGSETRLHGLDGFRVVGMLLVIAAHAEHAGLLPAARAISWRLHVGPTTIFFVLSGFLVSFLLMREQERSARIDLVRFYCGRLARLMPALIFFLACVGLLAAAGRLSVPPLHLLTAATFTTNLFESGWSTGHTWSLAVEEQFYLAWPLALVAVPKRHWVWLAVAVIGACTLARLAYGAAGVEFGLMYHATETRVDAFAWGALAAIAHRRLGGRGRRAHRLLGLAAAATAMAFTLHVLPLWPHTWQTQSVAFPAAMAACILAVVNAPGSLPTRALDSAPVRYLGATSYSVYLWQQLFFDVDHPVPAWGIALGLPAIVLVSYHGIERRTKEPVRGALLSLAGRLAARVRRGGSA